MIQEDSTTQKESVFHKGNLQVVKQGNRRKKGKMEEGGGRGLGNEYET